MLVNASSPFLDSEGGDPGAYANAAAVADGTVIKIEQHNKFTNFPNLTVAEEYNIVGFELTVHAAFGVAMNQIAQSFQVSLDNGGTYNAVSPGANFAALPNGSLETFGGSGNLWGYSNSQWNNIDFTASNQFVVRYVEPITDGQVIYLDFLEATVYYETAGIGGKMSISSGLIKISEGLIKL